MKTYTECYDCFERQAVRVARLAGLTSGDAHRVLDRVRQRLETFAPEQCPARMAAEIHEIIRREGGDPDPYRDAKRHTDVLARRVLSPLRRLIAESDRRFETAVRLSIAGNLIDYGARDHVSEADLDAAIAHAMEAPIAGAPVLWLYAAVQEARSILFIGDNSAECHFDLLLIEQLPAGRTTYAVRGAPILNDATRRDAVNAGIGEVASIVDTGDAAPGVLLDRCSAEFLEAFREADLVVAKGQGNYESLDDACPRDVAFLLKAKCPVVARNLGCEVGDIVLALQGAAVSGVGRQMAGANMKGEA